MSETELAQYREKCRASRNKTRDKYTNDPGFRERARAADSAAHRKLRRTNLAYLERSREQSMQKDPVARDKRYRQRREWLSQHEIRRKEAARCLVKDRSSRGTLGTFIWETHALEYCTGQKVRRRCAGCDLPKDMVLWWRRKNSTNGGEEYDCS